MAFTLWSIPFLQKLISVILISVVILGDPQVPSGGRHPHQQALPTLLWGAGDLGYGGGWEQHGRCWCHQWQCGARKDTEIGIRTFLDFWCHVRENLLGSWELHDSQSPMPVLVGGRNFGAWSLPCQRKEVLEVASHMALSIHCQHPMSGGRSLGAQELCGLGFWYPFINQRQRSGGIALFKACLVFEGELIRTRPGNSNYLATCYHRNYMTTPRFGCLLLFRSSRTPKANVV